MNGSEITSILDRYPALRELSREEKVHLILEVDQDLLAEEYKMPPDVEEMILEVLERRRQEYLADPSTGISLEEHRRRMAALKAERAAKK